MASINCFSCDEEVVYDESNTFDNAVRCKCGVEYFIRRDGK